MKQYDHMAVFTTDMINIEERLDLFETTLQVNDVYRFRIEKHVTINKHNGLRSLVIIVKFTMVKGIVYTNGLFYEAGIDAAMQFLAITDI